MGVTDKVKFWSGMEKASTVLGGDKMMIGKNATGEAQYVDFEQVNVFLNTQGKTISLNAPTGIPKDGDEWIIYAP